MTDNAKIKLRYFKTLSKGSQWFLLYEFEIDSTDFFEKSNQEIIQELMTTRVLNEKIYHSEMNNSEIELSRDALEKGVQRPYIFSRLELNDFEFISDLNEFKKWLLNFRTEGWKDDKEDAQILIEKAENEIYNRTKVEDGIWLLSKDKFKEYSDKLIEIHWIYLHFETFIEIDRTNKLIRTFDFGYD